MLGYDQLDRNTSIEEDNAAGTAVHTATYGYDADSDLSSQVHDGAPSTYVYNNLDEPSTETDAKSSTDTNPQVTTFPAYTPTGQAASETKPNGNTITSAYYANGLLDTQTENTPGGTLVTPHLVQLPPVGCGAVNDFTNGFVSTGKGLVKGVVQTATQPIRDVSGCIGGSAASCFNVFEDTTPIPALKQMFTGGFSTGKIIIHEFATGHPVEALGTIAALSLAAWVTKRLLLVPVEDVAPVVPEDVPTHAFRGASQSAPGGRSGPPVSINALKLALGRVE